MSRRIQQDQNFSQQRDILNFKPRINFVEPDQIDDELPVREQPVSLDSVKSDTDQLIADYAQIEDLSNLAQQRIDDRSAGLTIQLDSQADAHIISAVQRHFGDPNKTSITYDDYRECLDHINDQANFTLVDPAEVQKASQDQFRTDFGVFGADSPRPDLQSEAQSIQPVDLKSFQIQQLEELLKLLTPGITGIATKVAVDQIKKAF